MIKQKFQAVLLCLGALFFGATSSVATASENCNPDNGKKIFQTCAVCHSNDNTGKHGPAAPNLHGVVGREVGKVPGYKFSSALRKSGDTWTVEHLDAFLNSPMGVYPLTRMAFSGLKNEQDRRDVICMLNQTSN
ncbi:c-type cytochrome [Stutzerimonas nitrititolerans]|uniref:c-type cytochrome n=1 Tax=Pseudomonadaceae TaxID=135621 RepID=UPI0009ED722A|nr:MULTISPECIES: c-type cytochrome [Pseudomonadaceae]MBA1265137.1 c-type cytochrome [Stutzerimonas stutzeri]MCQ4310078.1 c-type cytochrome [Stutzerimonas stutzeri]